MAIIIKIYEVKDYDELGRKTANITTSQVLMKSDCVFGLAIDSTPIGTYRQLIEWYNRDDLDFSSVKSVNLDKYRGLTRDDSQSYYYFMYSNLFKRVNTNMDCTDAPDGTQSGSDKECSRYEDVIKSLSGIDLQLPGLGHNGHIGFNESDEEFVKTTHCVDLTQSTIEANKHFLAPINEVPKQTYTIGIGTIIKTKKAPPVINGSDKVQVLHDVFCGPIIPRVPASILQLRNGIIVVIDGVAMTRF